MKKTIIALLLCTALCAAVFAQTENDFKIMQNKAGTITITGYTGKVKDIIIPATIEGIKVTEIGADALRATDEFLTEDYKDGKRKVEFGFCIHIR